MPWLTALVAGFLALSAQAEEFADASGVDISVQAGVTYRMASGQDLKLDLYLPANRATKPVPLVMYIHGGGWIAGNREAANLRLMPFLQMGWAAANVSYRLAPVAPAPAAVEDVRCALRWLSNRAPQLGVDPQRIVLAGSSAGGHLALMAGLLAEGNRFDRACAASEATRWVGGAEPPVKVAAIVNWFGISDVGDLLQGANMRPYAVEWFGAALDREALAREISPIHQVRAGNPPVLSFHGDSDRVVPPAQSLRLHEALKRAKVPSQLILVPGAGHGLNRAQMVAAIATMRAFLKAQGLIDQD